MKYKNGANDRIRTDDLLITNELLYQLSYIGMPSLQGLYYNSFLKKDNLPF